MAVMIQAFIFRICEVWIEISIMFCDLIFLKSMLLNILLLYHTSRFQSKHDTFWPAVTKLVFFLLAKAAPASRIQLRSNSLRIYEIML
jgi:hypothetical protein